MDDEWDDMEELQIPFSAPLNKEDTESQTYGCRQTRSDVCSRNGIPGVCAFASEDHICRKPSRLWQEQYYRLFEAGLKKPDAGDKGKDS